MLESGCIYSERELINKCTVQRLTVMQSEVEATIKKLTEYSILLDKVKSDKILGVKPIYRLDYRVVQEPDGYYFLQQNVSGKWRYIQDEWSGTIEGVRGLWKKYVNIDENPIVQVDRDGKQL